jgi:hypothetical protein
MRLQDTTTPPVSKGGEPQTNGRRRGRPVNPRLTIPGAALDDPECSPQATAIIAACLVRGLVTLGCLTEVQACLLTGANAELFQLVNAFTTAELDAVVSGKLGIHDVIAARQAGARRVIDLSDRLAS